MSELRRQGIAGKALPQPHRRNKFDVEVARDDFARALSAAQAAAPRQNEGGAVEAHALPFLQSPEEQKQAALKEVAARLAQSIQFMSGVTDARVHLSGGTPLSLLAQDALVSKASVLVRTHDKVDLSGIKRLVAGAVEGLVEQEVRVVVALHEPPTRQPPQLARLGPFRMHAASVEPLRWTLCGILAANLLLASLLIWTRATVRRRGVPATGPKSVIPGPR